MSLLAPLQHIAGQLDEALTCAVCLSAATDAHALVACGHHFCEACITEALSRSPRCPTCRTESDLSRGVARALVKVHALDELQGGVASLRGAVDKAAVDVALAAAAASAEGAKHGAGAGSGNPVEALFQQALSGALLSCGAFLEELRVERDARIRDAERVYAAAAGGERRSGSGGAAAEAAAASPATEAASELRDAAVAAAHAAYSAAVSQLTLDVSSYLETVIPPVSLLPASVTVSVPPLGVRFQHRLRPFDTIDSAIVPAVMAAVCAAQRGKDGVSYAPDARWVWSEAPGPAPAPGAPPVGGAAAGGGGAAVVALSPVEPLFRQCPGGRPRAGAVLELQGGAAATSSRAGRCFASTYLAGSGQADDYFSCSSCALNWICSSCAETCHRSKGHALKPFIAGHRPTFACCYCKRKGCTLVAPAAAAAAGGAGAGGAPGR